MLETLFQALLLWVLALPAQAQAVSRSKASRGVEQVLALPKQLEDSQLQAILRCQKMQQVQISEMDGLVYTDTDYLTERKILC